MANKCKKAAHLLSVQLVSDNNMEWVCVFWEDLYFFPEKSQVSRCTDRKDRTPFIKYQVIPEAGALRWPH